MDIRAITELKSRAIEAMASQENYRGLAERHPDLRTFYHAVATTYERSAREMNIMIDKAERAHPLLSDAA